MQTIPAYSEGDRFEPSNIDLVRGETHPPQLLSEADLIALMDKHGKLVVMTSFCNKILMLYDFAGIGTDATHAEHIETIKSRMYVGVRNDGRFVPGELGMGLVEGDSLKF